MSKSNIVIVVVLLILFSSGIYIWSNNQSSAPTEPTPTTGDNTEEPSTNHPLITVVSPQPNQNISSPLTISGEARGNWYFEATFPVSIEDANGNQLAEGYATAQGDWMTTEFIPFTAQLTFSKPATKTGKLILKKSNASGLPENDDQIEIPVNF